MTADNEPSVNWAGQGATPPACAAPGCRRSPQRGHLCGHHRDHLGATLTELADLITDDPAPGYSTWRTGGGHTGLLASERSPVNLRLITAQTDAPTVLGAWADWVRDARQLAHPTITRVQRHPALARLVTYRTRAPRNPADDRALLAVHLDWILDQPEAAQFWCQIRALWSDLRGHRPVRRCTCGGPVWSDPGGGWCSWCATAWAGADLLRLGPAREATA